MRPAVERRIHRPRLKGATRAPHVRKSFNNNAAASHLDQGDGPFHATESDCLRVTNFSLSRDIARLRISLLHRRRCRPVDRRTARIPRGGRRLCPRRARTGLAGTVGMRRRQYHPLQRHGRLKCPDKNYEPAESRRGWVIRRQHRRRL